MGHFPIARHFFHLLVLPWEGPPPAQWEVMWYFPEWYLLKGWQKSIPSTPPVECFRLIPQCGVESGGSADGLAKLKQNKQDVFKRHRKHHSATTDQSMMFFGKFGICWIWIQLPRLWWPERRRKAMSVMDTIHERHVLNRTTKSNSQKAPFPLQPYSNTWSSALLLTHDHEMRET